MLLLLLLPSLSLSTSAPSGPQGPPGAVLRHDLLTDSFPGGDMGAFRAVYAEPCYTSDLATACNHNNEIQT